MVGREVCWFDADMFDVTEKELGEFMIRTLVIQKESGFIWNFINVYGATQNDQKQKFLSELSSFCSKCSHPMLIGGDFNILRKDSDKNSLVVPISGVPFLTLLLMFMS
jgi:exonuclease III